MSTWAVIPAKGFAQAKTRLAPALTPHERMDLARRLLSGAIGAALACPSLAGAVVVGSAADVRDVATRLGARACADPPSDGRDPLNAAVVRGCAQVAALGGTGALVLPADLPLLAPDAIAEFMDEAGDAPVALAPDRFGEGTNALLLRPPHAMEPLFGPASFARHRAAASARGLAVVTVRLPALALDLDTPDDLLLFGGNMAALRCDAQMCTCT